MAKLTLDVIHIAEPCEVPWETMRGDDQVRFCDLCHKNVYDFSRLSRRDANALLAEHGDTLCAQLYRRADGTIQTADCTPDRLAAARRAAKRTLAVSASVLGATLTLVAGLAAAFGAPPPPEPTRVLAGIDKLITRIDRMEPPPPEPEPEVRPLPGRIRRGGIGAHRATPSPFGD